MPVPLALLLRQDLDGRVDGDAVEPGPEAGAVIEAGERAVGAQERLLHRVLGARLVANDAEGHAEELLAVALHQRPERLGVPGPGSVHENGVVGFHATG